MNFHSKANPGKADDQLFQNKQKNLIWGYFGHISASFWSVIWKPRQKIWTGRQLIIWTFILKQTEKTNDNYAQNNKKTLTLVHIGPISGQFWPITWYRKWLLWWENSLNIHWTLNPAKSNNKFFQKNQKTLIFSCFGHILVRNL